MKEEVWRQLVEREQQPLEVPKGEHGHWQEKFEQAKRLYLETIERAVRAEARAECASVLEETQEREQRLIEQVTELRADCESLAAAAQIRTDERNEARAEVERLKVFEASSISWREAWSAAREVHWVARVKALEDALRVVEWCGHGDPSRRTGGRCPACWTWPGAGHTQDCVVGAALEGK